MRVSKKGGARWSVRNHVVVAIGDGGSSLEQITF